MKKIGVYLMLVVGLSLFATGCAKEKQGDRQEKSLLIGEEDWHRRGRAVLWCKKNAEHTIAPRRSAINGTRRREGVAIEKNDPML